MTCFARSGLETLTRFHPFADDQVCNPRALLFYGNPGKGDLRAANQVHRASIFGFKQPMGRQADML